MTRRDYDNGLDRDGQLSSTSQDGFGQVLELLTSQGFEGMAQAMATLLNEAMKMERSVVLGAESYERMRAITIIEGLLITIFEGRLAVRPARRVPVASSLLDCLPILPTMQRRTCHGRVRPQPGSPTALPRWNGAFRSLTTYRGGTERPRPSVRYRACGKSTLPDLVAFIHKFEAELPTLVHCHDPRELGQRQ